MSEITERLTEVYCCKCLSTTKKLYVVESLNNNTMDGFYCRKCATKKIKEINKLFKKLEKRCKKCIHNKDYYYSCDDDCAVKQNVGEHSISDSFEPIKPEDDYLKSENWIKSIFNENGNTIIDI